MVTATTRTRKKSAPAHPLAHLIPSMEAADEYVSRDVYGVRDIDLLRYAKEAGKHVLMSGPTGLGKSHCVAAYCATDKIPLVVIEAKDGIDPNTFFGGYVPKDGADVDEILTVMDTVTKTMPKGTSPEVIMQVTMATVGQSKFEWVLSDVVHVLTEGGCLFVDECNFMRPRVSATFHRVMRERQFSVLEQGNKLYTVHPDTQIVAAYNDGYEGTYPLNQAFRNRFGLKLELDYDPDVEGQLLCMPVLLEIATKLRNSDEIETPVSTNSLVEFEELSIDLGLPFATKNFVAMFSPDEKQPVQAVMALYEQQISDALEQIESQSSEAETAD